MTTKKAETKETEFFEFKNIRAQVIPIAETDSLHFVEEGDDLLLVMYSYRDLDAKRERWVQNTNGFRPRNTEASRYDAHGFRYSDSFMFRAGDVVTPGMVQGVNHKTTDEGKAALERMYKSEMVKKIGVVECAPGQGLVYRLTLEGADLLFGTRAIEFEQCAKPRGTDGLPKRVPAGALYLSTGSLCLSQSCPQMVERGTLVPEAILGESAAGLVAEGRLVPAGNRPTEFADLELTPMVAAYFRNVAAIREDNRRRGCSRDSDQTEFLAALLDAAINAASEAATA